MTIETLALRMEPMNGRLDLWAHSIAGLRPTTYNARIAAARHLIKWLGLIWPDHLQRARTGKRLPRTLTRRELSSVLDAASISENPASALVVTMMLDTGMRVSEICSLNLEDIDFDDGSARILGGKGDKDRLVLFTKRTIAHLEAWLPIRAVQELEEEQACFVNRRGRRLQPRGVQRMMDALAQEAGLPKGKLTPHVLRHNFATGLLERGADLVTIQRLMGHATIATTRVYLEISDQTLRQKSTIAHRLYVTTWTNTLTRLDTSKKPRHPRVLQASLIHDVDFFRLAILSGPDHWRCGLMLCPWCPSMGQNLPALQREQFPLGGCSTVFRKRPYFRRGMVADFQRQPSKIAVESSLFEPRHVLN